MRANGGYGEKTDRYLDLRVDDDPFPIKKLAELVEMHHLFFGETDPNDLVPLAEVAHELQLTLRRSNEYSGPVTGQFDETTRQALVSLVGKENMEDRWDGQADVIDRVVVDYLHKQFPE